MRQRLREILFFFRTNLAALLALTLPFAALSAAIVHVYGQPATFVEGQDPELNLSSMLPLALLQPLMLGVQVAGIHQLAMDGRLAAGPLLRHALRAWPALFLVSFPLGIAALGVVTVFLAAPGAWLYARLGLAPVLAVVEEAGPFHALGESWRRTAARQFELFSLVLLLCSALLLSLLLVSVLVKAADVADSPIADGLVRTFVELLLSLLSIAFYRQWTLDRQAAPPSTGGPGDV